MPIIEFKQGDILCQAGSPIEQLRFVTRGTVGTLIGKLPFKFEQKDMVGLCCDYRAGTHRTTYTALTDGSMFTYPCKSFDELQELFGADKNAEHLMVSAVYLQLARLLGRLAQLRGESDALYTLLKEAYPAYEKLCSRFAFSAKKLPGLNELARASANDPVESWVQGYYSEITEMDMPLKKNFFYGNAGVSAGFINRGMDDILKVLDASAMYYNYLLETSMFLLCREELDLFALVTELHHNSTNIQGADTLVEQLLKRMHKVMAGLSSIDRSYYQERFKGYQTKLASERSAEKTGGVGTGGLKQNLANSLETILKYSKVPEETANSFARQVFEFRAVPDRSGSEDTVYQLRKSLTKTFYEVYNGVLLNSLDDKNIPTVIKMFLNFGYVDAQLAGHDNADYMYSIADSVRGAPEKGIYTLYEWMLAIYKGQKQPSRDDFDMDYPAYIKEMRVSGKIDEREEKRLLNDQMGKLKFELENVFPIVNKVTFGRITTFCPLFGDHNVQRSLENAMVTAGLLQKTFDEIRTIDFSAYTRAVSYSNAECDIPLETIHVEIMPEMILMPNVGIRGAMWQEMEGRNRMSPARIFVPIFIQGDFKNMLINLTGEYRWELIKRIQGPRWGDLSDPTITSEYFNYLQFYRSNRDLSADAKNSVKTELLRARNNFKAVFTANYSEWLLYESKGSPRLNKIARRILTEYCPFSLDIREKLATNPQYTELLRRYDMKLAQRAKHLNNIVARVQKAKKKVPEEIMREFEYVKR